MDSFGGKSPAELAREALEKARREKAEEIQRKIQSTLMEIQQEKSQKASKIMLDGKGNLVDASGNIMNIPMRPVATLKANLNKMRQHKLKLEKPVDLKRSSHFDPEMPIPKYERSRRGFAFVEEGSYIKKADKMRNHAARRELSKIINQQRASGEHGDASTSGVGSLGDVNMIPLGPRGEKPTKELLVLGEPVPDVEWWDANVLQNKSYDDIKDGKMQVKGITLYVEHPLSIPPAYEGPAATPLPLMLTKRERKKLRTQTRLAREKEKQQKIRLGAMPPPPPKVTMKNMMKVLGPEAAQDPTKIERMVLEQVQQRKDNHERRNHDRMLSPEQRKEKRKLKMAEDASQEIVACIFKVVDVSNQKHKFKLEAKAKEFSISGCVITCEGTNIVIAEGGPKAIRKFAAVLLEKIDWNKAAEPSRNNNNSNNNTSEAETSSSATANNTDGVEGGDSVMSEKSETKQQAKPKLFNKCTQVWQGTVKRRSFRYFKFMFFVSDATARKFLQDHGVAHYWDMSANFNENEEGVISSASARKQQLGDDD